MPLKAAVAGIAMGLVSGEIDGRDVVRRLTDILGAEDAFGDMDLSRSPAPRSSSPRCSSTPSSTASRPVLAKALTQGQGRPPGILEVMAEAIDAPGEMSPTRRGSSPSRCPVDKIGEVIGPKGKVINRIQDDTGAGVSIEDDGTVYIGATNGEAAEAARSMINAIANPTMPGSASATSAQS